MAYVYKTYVLHTHTHTEELTTPSPVCTQGNGSQGIQQLAHGHQGSEALAGSRVPPELWLLIRGTYCGSFSTPLEKLRGDCHSCCSGLGPVLIPVPESDCHLPSWGTCPLPHLHVSRLQMAEDSGFKPGCAIESPVGLKKDLNFPILGLTKSDASRQPPPTCFKLPG